MKRLIVLAGCNGAGKTTAAFGMLEQALNVREFVNADEIAKGISPFYPEGASIQAGRIMLERINELVRRGDSFAFETTLSSKIFAPLIKRLRIEGYQVTLVFFWLSSSELAIRRVQKRVEGGGHSIPKDVIERRYHRGLHNFFTLYMGLADEWIFIDNSSYQGRVIADSTGVHEPNLWKIVSLLRSTK